VTYVFIAVHYPEPEHRDRLIESMRGMAAHMAGRAGFIEAGPWAEYAGGRVVGLSRWESRAAFEAAMPGSGVPNSTIHQFETRPREYFHLEEP
jgi:heme-degrading monooxygenase HmoA